MSNLLAWLRLFLLGCLFFSGISQARYVDVLRDTSGNQVGIQDTPTRGETPAHIHRRYCAEAPTSHAIWASVLTPNGITNDRLMQAGRRLNIHCVEIRASYRVKPPLQAVVEEQTKAITTLTDRIRGLEGRVDALQSEIQSVSRSSASTRQLVLAQMEITWWQSSHFWILFLLISLLIVVGGVLLLLSRGQRSERSIASLISRSAYPAPGKGGMWWYEPIPEPNNGFSLYLLVPEHPYTKFRLFRYLVERQTVGTYPDVLGKQWGTIDALGWEMHKLLTRYADRSTAKSSISERQAIDAAISQGVLVEATAPLPH